jgi:hypothetical protein
MLRMRKKTGERERGGRGRETEVLFKIFNGKWNVI